MSDIAKGMLEQSKPWKADVKWPIVAAEAVLLIGLGLFMLISTESAGNWILQVVGVVFLVLSLQLAMVSFRSAETGLGTFDSFRAGIGVTVGVISTSLWWSDSIPNAAVRLILGWGLITFAVLQLVGLFKVRGRDGLRPATMVLSAMTLVLGILLLTSSDHAAESRIMFLGVVLLVFGVLLGGLAFMLKGRAEAHSGR